MSSILETIQRSQYEDARASIEVLENKMADILRLAKKGGDKGCSCYICRAAEVLNFVGDCWEELLAPMARIISGVSLAFDVLKIASNKGFVGLDTTYWREELDQLLDAGTEHKCDNPMCVINDALDIIKGVPPEKRVDAIAVMADFLTIIDEAEEATKIMERKKLLQNPN